MQVTGFELAESDAALIATPIGADGEPVEGAPTLELLDTHRTADLPLMMGRVVTMRPTVTQRDDGNISLN